MNYRISQQFLSDFAGLNATDQAYARAALNQFSDGEKHMRTDPIITRSSSEVWCVPFGPRHVFTYSFVVGGTGDMLSGGELICVLRSIGQRDE